MEPSAAQMPAPAQMSATCPVCHQQVAPEYYFCPNCGAKIHEPPLPTDAFTQLWLYLFSIILPIIAYLLISKWKGLKYFRSQDQKARWIGTVAFILLILSSALSFWYAYVWTEGQIQQSVNEINADMSI